MVAITAQEVPGSQSHWDDLAAKARTRRRTGLVLIYGFLIAASIPIITAYFWLVTLSFSARLDDINTEVLWPSIFILVPSLVAIWVWAMVARTRTQAFIGWGIICLATVVIYWWLLGDELHTNNYRFLFNRDFNAENKSIVAAEDRLGFSATAFPSVWTAALNSLFIAILSTIIVTTVASLSAYYISRFQFPLRVSMLRSLLVLHAFPSMTLIIPMFLVLWYIGLLDTLWGVMLVLVGFELPFAIFIMKGFFDAVPWEIEMSAIVDGATRRQAFVRVVLPHVVHGLIAISVFTFIRGWEEYIFMFTFLINNNHWTMSLFMFFTIQENSLGIDFGLVSAVAVFYVFPAFVLYAFAQKYLLQMSVGGVKG